MENHTISKEEAVELNKILQIELDEARAGNDFFAFLAILVIIGFIAAMLSD